MLKIIQFLMVLGILIAFSSQDFTRVFTEALLEEGLPQNSTINVIIEENKCLFPDRIITT